MTGFAGHYRDLLRQARRHARRTDEAEDLLHSVLLAAVSAGRADLGQAANRRWISGALRRRAAFDARSALRRRRREAAAAMGPPPADPPPGDSPEALLAPLSPGLRRVLLLALSGHTRAEIAAALDLTDAALRQRIAAIRRQSGGHPMPAAFGPRGALAFGAIRRALLPVVRHAGEGLGSHDPDGHLFVLTSQKRGLRQLPCGERKPEE